MRQFDQISGRDYQVFLNKLNRFVLLLCKLPLYFLAFFLVLIMRLISPIVIIRLAALDMGRIGGGVYKGDWYLSQKAEGLHLGPYFDFFYFYKSTNHVNRQWVKMWKRVLPWLPGSELWQKVHRLNRLFPEYQNHEIPDSHVYPTQKVFKINQIDPISKKKYKNNILLKAVLKNENPNISFSLHEEEKGARALDNLGIPKGKQYICFHARDSAYLNSVLPRMDWSYHDYRDSTIQNYIPAAEEMVNRGYFAVRMGAVVKESIQSTHTGIIDYAISALRTDFNDIYIGSHCRFFLCSDGGISTIPEMHRKLVIYTNWTRLNGLITSSIITVGLVILKKFYLKNENRCLSFSEIMSLKFDDINTNKIFTKLNLELIENTPEEIRAVTVEMDERISGAWQTTEEDEELQDRFWALFGPDKLKSPNLRIGADYLRKNKGLIC